MAVAEAEARGEDRDEVLREWLAQEAPRLGAKPLLFTHALSASPEESREAMRLVLRYIGDRRRLFVVRDPRDVVVSYYFDVTRRQRRNRSQEPISLGRFVRDSGYGIDRVLHFMRAVAESVRDDPGPAMLLSYERVHSDTLGSLRRALDFFGLAGLSEDVLRSAVEFGRFENMQRLEREGTFGGPNRRLRARGLSDPESFKARRGEIGRYREYLSAEEIAYVECRIGELQPALLGYREPGVPPDSGTFGTIASPHDDR
jgi:hypothetical protein